LKVRYISPEAIPKLTRHAHLPSGADKLILIEKLGQIVSWFKYLGKSLRSRPLADHHRLEDGIVQRSSLFIGRLFRAV